MNVTEPNQCGCCSTAAGVLLAGQMIAMLTGAVYFFWPAVQCFIPLLGTGTGGGNCVWSQSSTSGQ